MFSCLGLPHDPPSLASRVKLSNYIPFIIIYFFVLCFSGIFIDKANTNGLWLLFILYNWITFCMLCICRVLLIQPYTRIGCAEWNKSTSTNKVLDWGKYKKSSGAIFINVGLLFIGRFLNPCRLKSLYKKLVWLIYHYNCF